MSTSTHKTRDERNGPRTHNGDKKSKLAQFVYDSRVRLGLTQIQLAKRMRITTYRTVMRWEADLAVPSLLGAREFARVVGCSIDDLAALV